MNRRNQEAILAGKILAGKVLIVLGCISMVVSVLIMKSIPFYMNIGTLGSSGFSIGCGFSYFLFFEAKQ